MVFVRSLLFNLAFYAWTAFWGVIAFLTVPLPQKWMYFPQALWSKSVQKLMPLAGITVEIRGIERLPDKPVLIASKHQSAWDTSPFFGTAGPLTVVMKRELMWIPLIGWYFLRWGQIPIDRQGGGKALRAMVGAAREAVARGRSILIFPEGTRTPVGSDKPFLPGVAALYSMLDLDVVPVALNSGVAWPRRSFLKYPGKIIMEYLPPIPKGLEKKQFMKRLKDDIESGTARLVKEARAHGKKS